MNNACFGGPPRIIGFTAQHNRSTFFFPLEGVSFAVLLGVALALRIGLKTERVVVFIQSTALALGRKDGVL